MHVHMSLLWRHSENDLNFHEHTLITKENVVKIWRKLLFGKEHTAKIWILDPKFPDLYEKN